MLNPYRIVLTGRFATAEVGAALEEHFETFDTVERILGDVPEIDVLKGQDNDYIRVRGAALAVFRESVHRQLDELSGARNADLHARFADLTIQLTEVPWA